MFSREDGRMSGDATTEAAVPCWCWGTEPEFQNRVVQHIEQGSTGRPRLIAEWPVPDGWIRCDACGREVTERPFPVVPGLIIAAAGEQSFLAGGGFALCGQCARQWGIVAGEQKGSGGPG
ncbi:MAG TPA: hypothetical protein GX513_05970 [Firmicutes bacterium]|nr:hypothetical protein [Bacillota bacterium]